MEEVNQLVNLVKQVACDESLRQELQQKPEAVIRRERFSPMVAAVVMRLVPHLTLDKLADDVSLDWWNY